jgi:hypothetical protein
MRIPLDHNTPAPLRYALRGHQVETAYERGWAELLNGDLIAEAESACFDLLITTDQRQPGFWRKSNAAQGRRRGLRVHLLLHCPTPFAAAS